MYALQDGYTIHKTFASNLGVRAGIRDEAVHRAVHSVSTTAHILRLSTTTVRPMLDHRRLRAQRKQSILTILIYDNDIGNQFAQRYCVSYLIQQVRNIYFRLEGVSYFILIIINFFLYIYMFTIRRVGTLSRFDFQYCLYTCIYLLLFFSIVFLVNFIRYYILRLIYCIFYIISY